MRRIHTFWGAAAAFFGLAGLIFCALGLRTGTLLVKTDRDPGRVVTAFFEELSAGELEAAYARLSNYKTLGLEKTPRTPEGALLLEALRSHCACTLVGAAEQRGDRAQQPIRLRFLDLDAVEGRILRGEAADIREALSAGEITAQEDFLVSLEFDGEAWKIVLEPELLDAIQGHAGGEGAL